MKPTGIKPTHKLGNRSTHVYCSAGENRLRYFQLLMNGSYTPRTLPVGGEEAREVSPRSLAEALLVKPLLFKYTNVLFSFFVHVLVYLKSLPKL